MATINYSVLQFKSSLSVFLNFAKEYNEEKTLRDQLRPQHVKIKYKNLFTTI